MTEPAVKSYFFGKGYKDLYKVIIEGWKLNINSAKHYFSKIDSSGEWWQTVASVLFFSGASLSVVIFGSAVFIFLSFLHIVALSIIFSVIYICFTIVYLIERIFLFFKQFFTVCPHCHEKTLIPEYLCPKCGVFHQSLVPNSYGVFYHRCTCGEKLPATFFLDRGELQARCTVCHQFLDRKYVEAKRIFIPIIGGKSAGKSAFVFSVVKKMINKEAVKYGFGTKFIDPATKREYDRIDKALQAGYTPPATPDSVPKAFNLELTKDGKTAWIIYFYDPAGEAFQNTTVLHSHKFLKYFSVMIFIIDPFSIPAVKESYGHKLSRSTVNPSSYQASDVLGKVLLTMEETFGISAKKIIDKPVSVVLTKVDAFGLDRKIGKKAIDKEHSKNPDLDRVVVKNTLIRQQLAEWGESGLLKQLDMQFSNVEFFSCSSLTKKSSRAGSGYVSHGVFDPVLKIFQSIDQKAFSSDKVMDQE